LHCLIGYGKIRHSVPPVFSIELKNNVFSTGNIVYFFSLTGRKNSPSNHR
jgi:hypothetical protein